MLQKLPLTLCSRTFVSLNISQIFFKCVSSDLPNPPHQPASLLHTCKDPLHLNNYPFSKFHVLSPSLLLHTNVNGIPTSRPILCVSLLASLKYLLALLLFMSIYVGANSSYTNLFMNCQMTLSPHTWKLSLHGNPFARDKIHGMLNDTLRPL